MTSRIYLAIPLLVVLIILQTTVLPQVTVFGIMPQLLLVASVAWGLLYGLQEGLLLAFVSGLLVDIYSASPLGATSLAGMVAIALVVTIKQHFPENRVVLPALLTALATLVFWFVYLLLLRLLMPFVLNNLQFLGLADLAGSSRGGNLVGDIAAYYGLRPAILQYVLISALVQGLLVLPVYWAFYTLGHMLRPRGVEI